MFPSALVKLYLECRVQFWAPKYKTDMGLPEQVQRGAVKIKG